MVAPGPPTPGKGAARASPQDLVLALLEQCSTGVPSEVVAHTLALQGACCADEGGGGGKGSRGAGPPKEKEIAEDFSRLLHEGVFWRLLQAPHQRPCAATASLRALAGAVLRAEAAAPEGESKGFAQRAVRWLLSASGGNGNDACDTGVRWRHCVLLTALLSERPAGGAFDGRIVKEATMLLLARVRDRHADVRLAALEGLPRLLPLSPAAPPAPPKPAAPPPAATAWAAAAAAASDRLARDCDSGVRAAAALALVFAATPAAGAAVAAAAPGSVVVRARFDAAPRVRRAALQAIEHKVRGSAPEWAAAWPEAVLHGLRDRSRAVRAAAARCLLAAADEVGGSFPPALMADLDQLEAGAPGLVAALAGLARLPPEERPKLAQDLLTGPALTQAGRGPAEALLARVAAQAAASAGEPSPTGAAAAALPRALQEQRTFELRQHLLSLLAGELPPDSAQRGALVKAAAGVLRTADLALASEELLGGGAFPAARLGAATVPAPAALLLAVLLLRRVAKEGDPAHVEASFTRLAASIFGVLKEAWSVAERDAHVRGSEAAAARQDLEELRWAADAQQRAGSIAVGLETRGRELEDALRKAEASAAAAEAERNERGLRLALVAGLWLQHSRAALSRDGAQAALLESALGPVVRAAGLGHAAQVAAVHGIATLASRCEEQARAHWPFFLGLLEAQLHRLRAGRRRGGGGGGSGAGSEEEAPPCVAARLAEIALLFLSDALLLHGASLEPTRAEEVFIAVSHLLMVAERRDGAAGEDLDSCHLRAVACDRACTLLVMGHADAGGVPARWVLGRLLAAVCGADAPARPAAAGRPDGASDPCGYTALVPAAVGGRHRETATSVPSAARVAEAVAAGRLLRFFATLPLLSPRHAELLAQAAEAFFGARLFLGGGGWGSTPAASGTTPPQSSRTSPAARAARLVCARLAARGGGPELRLRVLRAAAAALLAAPKASSGALSDALVAGVLAAGPGAPPLEWAGEAEAPALRAALADLLRDWQPVTTARAVALLLDELCTQPAAPDAGMRWAQSALDDGADFRHDLAMIGLAGPSSRGLGFSSISRGPVAPARPPAPKAAAPLPPAPPQPEEPPPAAGHAHQAWHLVDLQTREVRRLQGHAPLVVGRRPTCGVVLQETSVSGEHCSIACGDGGAVVCDLGSVNGTYVNGRRLGRGGSAELHPGDIIALAERQGRSFLVGVGDPAAPLPQPGVAEEPPPAQKRGRAALADAVASPRPGKRPRHAGAASAADVDSMPSAEKVSNPAAGEAGVMPMDLDKEAFSKSQDAAVTDAALPIVDRVALAVITAEADQSATRPRLVDLATGTVHELPLDGVASVGRRADCEVVVKDNAVSSRHCVLACCGGRVEVEDVSSNGTYINGAVVPKGFSVPQHVALRHGDRLTLSRRQGPALLFLAAAVGASPDGP